jgi:uncharacterized membrane protein YgdD (TMEM256/DUF423 family)
VNAARAAAAFGALACGASVALAALAMHGAEGHAREQLALAALFAFMHGLGLVAIVARDSRLANLARAALALGVALFCGSLVAAALLGAPTAAAPAGGLAMMAGWAILAVDFLRRPRDP